MARYVSVAIFILKTVLLVVAPWRGKEVGVHGVAGRIPQSADLFLPLVGGSKTAIGISSGQLEAKWAVYCTSEII